MHVSDGYPFRWPQDPPRWLAGRDRLGAWVSESDGDIDGHLSLLGLDETRARREWREGVPAPVDRLAVISRFFVAPGARGRGIGSALLRAAEEHATTNDLRLVLEVADHNHDAIAFYERRGWERVGNASLLLDDGHSVLPLLLFVLPEST